jgi:hypothetical protein
MLLLQVGAAARRAVLVLSVICFYGQRGCPSPKAKVDGGIGPPSAQGARSRRMIANVKRD